MRATCPRYLFNVYLINYKCVMTGKNHDDSHCTVLLEPMLIPLKHPALKCAPSKFFLRSERPSFTPTYASNPRVLHFLTYGGFKELNWLQFKCNQYMTKLKNISVINKVFSALRILNFSAGIIIQYWLMVVFSLSK